MADLRPHLLRARRAVLRHHRPRRAARKRPPRRSRRTRPARRRTARPSATCRCGRGSPRSTASIRPRSSSRTGRCRPTRSSSTRSSSPATRSSSRSRRTTARCSGCASAGRRSCPSSSSPTASTSRRSRSCSRAACGRSSPTSSPTSRTRPATRSRARSATALLELAREYDFLVFEDDPYVELRFAGPTLPTMLSLDTDEHVVYASSFSKTVCPGIRVGYLVGPAELIAKIDRLATNTYISPNMVAQSIVNQFCRGGRLQGSIETVKAALKERAARLGEALNRELPEARFVPTEGGYFMWVDFPDDVDVDAVFTAAGERGVAFVKGSDFLLEGGRAQPAPRLQRRDPRADRRGRPPPRRGRARAPPASPRPPSGAPLHLRTVRTCASLDAQVRSSGHAPSPSAPHRRRRAPRSRASRGGASRPAPERRVRRGAAPDPRRPRHRHDGGGHRRGRRAGPRGRAPRARPSGTRTRPPPTAP